MLDEPTLKTWVAALRSGKYKQGCGRLRSSDNKFCCLGVLCDQLDQTAWSYWIDGYSWEEYIYALDDSVLGRNTLSVLMGMNDGVRGNRKHTFSEIADYIETNLIGENQ